MGANPAASTNVRILRLTQLLIFGRVCLFFRIFRHTKYSQASKEAARGIHPYCALSRSNHSHARNRKCAGCVAASRGSKYQPATEFPTIVTSSSASANSCTNICVGALPHRVQHCFSGNICNPQFSPSSLFAQWIQVRDPKSLFRREPLAYWSDV